MSLLAGLRERRTLGQIAEKLASSRARAVVLRDATLGLIACVKALAVDVEEIGTPKLKAALDATLERLRADGDSDTMAGALAEELVLRQRETLEFAGTERQYLDDRDAELRRIITVLTDGLTIVGDGNAAFDRQILDKGARLEAVSQLGDIVRMRELIAREVGDLRRAVADRQAEDAARTAALTREVELLRKDIEVARAEAATDPLTGAANRSAFDAELARLCDLAAAGGDGFALLMVDIDHFKNINDTHGHPVGDRVLMALVGFCREHVRKSDMVARWGGEEFAILLQSASARAATGKAQRIVKALGARAWSVDVDAEVSFTVSVGVTAWQRGDTAAPLVERADQALYQAKDAGRNRVVRAT